MKIQEYPRKYAREAKCPHCRASNLAYVMSGMSDSCPHFYCDRCSNVILRESDRDLLRTEQASEELLNKIASTLPHCPCGGRFAPNANPKCRKCGGEFKHQSDAVSRLADPFMICAEGACVFGDASEPGRPYQVKFTKPKWLPWVRGK